MIHNSYPMIHNFYRTMQPFKAALLNITVVAVAAAVGYGAVKTSLNAFNLKREGENVKAQIAALEAKKSELLRRLDDWKYPATLERKIRSDLGLKRPGENVVIIAESATATPLTAEPQNNKMPWWRRLLNIFRK